MQGLRIWIIGLLICLNGELFGQSDAGCSIILFNGAENRVMQNAEVWLPVINKTLITNTSGSIQPGSVPFPLTLEIRTLTCKRNYVAQQCGDTVWVDCPDISLPTAEYVYLDAKAIVRKAAARIPDNYPDSSFVLFGFFRNYKNINHRFSELTEARVISAMRISSENERLICKEAFGIQQLRRTPFTIDISFFYDNALEDLFRQNMIYHTAMFPLSDLYIDHTTFVMDSAATTDSTWTILYAMHRVTGENHGVDNYVPEDFAGEGRETGLMVIDRNSYAILKLVRESVRNPKYAYPGHNNFLHPDLQYTGEFIEGYLELEYIPTDLGYVPKHIFHAYTSTFTHVATNTETYRITDYSEWISYSVGTVISEEDYPLLLSYRNDFKIPYSYSAEDWQDTPPWVFIRKNTVWEDLQLKDDPERLFMFGGR